MKRAFALGLGLAIVAASPALANEAAAIVGETNWSLVIAIVTLEAALLSSAIGVVWKLSRSEIAMRAEAAAKFNELQIETEKRIGEIKIEALKEVAAVSAKLYQVEIWSRDEFVRKGSFEIVVSRMEKGLTDLRSELAGRFDRMDERLRQVGHG